MTRSQRLILVLSVLASVSCFSLCGCNRSGLVPVAGTVRYSDGTPVTGQAATIVFHPESGNSPSKSASGTIGEDGSFALMTVKPGDGVYPGTYKVVLKVTASYRSRKLAVPREYSEVATTPLTATIETSNLQLEFTIDK